MTTSNTIETTFKKYFTELRKEHKKRVKSFLSYKSDLYYERNYLSKKKFVIAKLLQNLYN